MARTRNIKPGFFKNEELSELSPFARLLFAGLWTLADRDGKLEDRPKRIKTDVLPYDNQDVETLLKSLADAKFIIRYKSGGQQYISIPSFGKHQNPHKNEPSSTIPAPKRSGASTVHVPEENSSNREGYLPQVTNHDSLTTAIDPPVNETSVPLPSDGIDAPPVPECFDFTVNGKIHCTVEMRKTMFDEIAARMLKLHAKKDAPILFEQYFASALEHAPDAPAKAREIEERHKRWCEYWKREYSGPNYWPKLSQWLADGTYTQEPPAVTETKLSAGLEKQRTTRQIYDRMFGGEPQ